MLKISPSQITLALRGTQSSLQPFGTELGIGGLGAIDFRLSYFLTAIGRYGGRGSYP